MRTTIDGVGCLVVPKTLRDALGLRAGQQLDVRVREGRLEVEPAPTPMHLEDGPHGPSARPDVDLPPLSATLVRDTLEQTRR